MPIKTSMELDDLLFDKEPMYDEQAMLDYCVKHDKKSEELSEEERAPFIKGYLSFGERESE